MHTQRNLRISRPASDLALVYINRDSLHELSHHCRSQAMNMLESRKAGSREHVRQAPPASLELEMSGTGLPKMELTSQQPSIECHAQLVDWTSELLATIRP